MMPPETALFRVMRHAAFRLWLEHGCGDDAAALPDGAGLRPRGAAGLSFHHHAPGMRHGRAGAARRRSRRVVAACVRDLAPLDAYEGLAYGLYCAVTLPVMKDGRRRAALVYVAASRMRGRPRSGYMEVVMAAARAAALPPDYARDLGRHWF
jgi:hypothetical protein